MVEEGNEFVYALIEQGDSVVKKDIELGDEDRRYEQRDSRSTDEGGTRNLFNSGDHDRRNDRLTCMVQ